MRKQTHVESVVRAHQEEKKTQEIEEAKDNDPSPLFIVEDELEEASTPKQVKKSRRTYTPKLKSDILDCYLENGETYTLIEQSVPRGTLKNLQNGEESFQDQRKNNSAKPILGLDPLLLEYIKRKRELHWPVSVLMVQKKALEVSKDANFKVSNSWVKNFLKRNSLVIRKKLRKYIKCLRIIKRMLRFISED